MNMNSLLLSPIGSRDDSIQFLKSETELFTDIPGDIRSTFASSVTSSFKGVPLEKLTSEQVMELVERDDDLKLIVDKDMWDEMGVDGKYLS